MIKGNTNKKPKMVFCPRCDAPFKKMDAMIEHMRRSHPAYFKEWIEE